jgi:peptidoglycan/LPS O-acetylase OafA/YrhL
VTPSVTTYSHPTTSAGCATSPHHSTLDTRGDDLASRRPTSTVTGTPTTGSLRRFRPDIQGLRAIAVLLVVFYHADVPYVRAGYVGVDVFFVISGFLITGGLLREVATTGRISFVAFYAGRTRRLLLPAAVMVLVTLAATRAWVSVFQIKGVTVDAVWSTFYAINYRLAKQGIDYQQSSAPPSPLQHMWSLAVEEQFYVVWPLLITACLLLAHRRRLLWTLAPALGLVMVASFFFSVTATVENPPLAYFSLHTRAWELAVGASVSLAATKLTRLPGPVAATASWTGVLGIVGSALYYSDDTAFPGSAAALPVLATALVIAAGCRPSRGSAEKVLDLRIMQGLGTVS